ncbi:hypothetical protein [Sansalvadorimonas verongulae]|uniref:hypothetical protein n=1 Tax=Sansalvadorimonas verongulae TaxID=2172824 RepID=UPI0012BCFAE1|nr:hypothetical protein [Sansalvadorimonas verongulae]MTI13036.1 hypothetical protein [Sansalvadorimonas verongulae]
MVYRNTAPALLLKAVLSASLITTGAAFADAASDEDNENPFADKAGCFNSITLQTADDVTHALVDYLRGKTVTLTGELSQIPPMQKIPLKSHRETGVLAEYYPYVFKATVEGVSLPSLIFYSKTEREEGSAEVSGIFNEQNAKTGTQGSGMLYLKETNS